MRPLVLALAVSLLPIAAAGVPPARVEAVCGGVAPATTACTTGEHLSVLPDLEARGGADYTGTVVSTLSSFGRSVSTRCSFSEGVSLGCVTTPEGGDPAPVLFARHTCESLDLTTGAPGGRGAWSCAVTDVA